VTTNIFTNANGFCQATTKPASRRVGARRRGQFRVV
jgi:hypothetical protein